MTAPERIFIDPVSGNRAWRELEGDIPYTRADLVTQWVSVEDALPELWDEVMVIVAHRPDSAYPRHLLRNDTGTWMDEWGHIFEGQDLESTVTHWMPLPQPPKDAK